MTRPPRPGKASIEAVIALGVTFPLAVLVVVTGLRASKAFYHMVASLVCWPYL